MGVAVAFILDLLDRSVKSVQDAQEILRYPLLGQIPDVTSQKSRASRCIRYDQSL